MFSLGEVGLVANQTGEKTGVDAQGDFLALSLQKQPRQLCQQHRQATGLVQYNARGSAYNVLIYPARNKFALSPLGSSSLLPSLNFILKP